MFWRFDGGWAVGMSKIELGLGVGDSPPHTPVKTNRRSFVASALLLSLSAAAPLRAANKPQIGVSLLTLTNPFFRDLGAALTEEAAKSGFEVVLVSGDFDAAKQRNQVSDFITRKAAAIVLSPCDSKAVATSIAEANKAGIPVFTVDIAALGSGKVVCHVATDNLGGGRLAGKAMLEALGGRGKVAILDHPEIESVMLRTQGFTEELAAYQKANGHTLEIVAKLPGGGAKDKSFKATEDLLQSQPDLKGIFAINDPSALGAVAALEKAGKLGQIKIVGFDGMPEGRTAIRAGQIYADPIQFPDRIGRTAFQQIRKYLDGDDVAPQILIPTQLYKQADAQADRSLKP